MLPAGTGSVSITAVARFEETARRAIHALKYTGHYDIATVLGPLMASGLDGPTATLIPVPLHWKRKRSRGYNQAALLAKHMGVTLGWPVNSRSLRRHRNTKDQITLSASERQVNVAGAFRWTGAPVLGRVILVDDVSTTGATLKACAQAIRAGGCSGSLGAVVVGLAVPADDVEAEDVPVDAPKRVIEHVVPACTSATADHGNALTPAVKLEGQK
jgi:ComF family protein